MAGKTNQSSLNFMPDKPQRTECEVFSRVCGYLRPVKQWNDGKQAEFYDRKTYSIEPKTK
jgi:anaerobic ribonucleoside-triphosphate reductase